MQLLHNHIQLVQFGIPLLDITYLPLHMLSHLFLRNIILLNHLLLPLALNRWLEVDQVVGQHLGGTDHWMFVGGDGRYVVGCWGYFGLIAVVCHCVES